MIAVAIVYHRDGDSLELIRRPWWNPVVMFIANRFCPCCGVSGWLGSKAQWLFYGFTKPWETIINWLDKHDKIIYTTPIADSCVASEALWGDHGNFCWREDCPINRAKAIEEVTDML